MDRGASWQGSESADSETSIAQLGHVVNLIGGGTPSKSNESFYEGGIPWATVRDMKQEYLVDTEFKISQKAVKQSSTNIIKAGNVIIATRVGLGKICILQQDTAINQDLKALIPKDSRLEKSYLFWWLKSIAHVIEGAGTGATVKGVRIPFINSLKIPLPSIPEQKRIVAILDQAFADIEQARAKTEQNLKNARELFESYLQQVFSQRGEGWVDTNLGEKIDLLTGFAFKSKEYVEHTDSVPLIRGDNVIQGKLRWDEVKLWPKDKVAAYEKYKLEEEDIVLAMDRTWVKAGMKYSRIKKDDLPALLVQRVARLRCSSTLNSDYLFYLIGSKLFESYVLSIQTGLGVPHISGKQIQSFNFRAPSIEQQKLIVNTLNKLAHTVSHLNKIYQKKLVTIDELKKSLLQKAFTGELTTINTSTPQFSANIMALAYSQHLNKQREKTFGHVKAQKILHMVERLSSINLGRAPIKDAAGPNDFHHMKNAEVWAETNQFFKFVERSGGGYNFIPLAKFNPMLAKAKEELAVYKSSLTDVVNLFVHKDTKQTEVYATVHSAWNNLLLDGKEITDDAILFEARENWHPDKLEIPKALFIQAIQEIRDNNLMPSGSGKYVAGQLSLIS